MHQYLHLFQLLLQIYPILNYVIHLQFHNESHNDVFLQPANLKLQQKQSHIQIQFDNAAKNKGACNISHQSKQISARVRVENNQKIKQQTQLISENIEYQT